MRGCFQIHSDAFGWVPIHLDAFRCIGHCSSAFGEFEFFANFSGVGNWEIVTGSPGEGIPKSTLLLFFATDDQSLGQNNYRIASELQHLRQVLGGWRVLRRHARIQGGRQAETADRSVDSSKVAAGCFAPEIRATQVRTK